jgi:sugar phosphate isomerase/epimerase
MRISISNIAWDPNEDCEIVNLLHRYSIDAIDIAPGKYFPQPMEATDEDIIQLREWWSDLGIEISGMQALLFGTTGLNLFGTPESQAGMLAHLEAVCRIGSGLGAQNLVFGSPKNRDCRGLSKQDTLSIASDFFSRLGDRARDNGVVICLEPNPTCYGANFMTTSFETAEVVALVDHPAIRMQFDTGALAINGEDPVMFLEQFACYVAHVHASEPDLVPLGDSDTDHWSISVALQRYLPEHVVTIEMISTTDEPHTTSIDRAMKYACRFYRNGVT